MWTSEGAYDAELYKPNRGTFCAWAVGSQRPVRKPGNLAREVVTRCRRRCERYAGRETEGYVCSVIDLSQNA